jgi:chemotaxis protein MotB
MDAHKDKEKNVIIIKRVKKIHKGSGHGGSWKIAYADFVTAMMAFFLLMWLLSLLNKAQIAGIAEYFKNPRKEHVKENMGIEKNKEKEKEKNTQMPEEPIIELKNQKPNDPDAEKKLVQIKKDLENKLETIPELKQFKTQLNFTITANGLKIELHDL